MDRSLIAYVVDRPRRNEATRQGVQHDQHESLQIIRACSSQDCCHIFFSDRSGHENMQKLKWLVNYLREEKKKKQDSVWLGIAGSKFEFAG